MLSDKVLFQMMCYVSFFFVKIILPFKKEVIFLFLYIAFKCHLASRKHCEIIELITNKSFINVILFYAVK